MYFNHPFGSWGEMGNGQSASSTWNGAAPTPSIYGALPYPNDSSAFQTFYFTNFSPDILNCTVIGPQAQVYYRIVTDNQMPGYTVVKNSEGKNVSLIEWQSHPMIEVRGLLTKQYVRAWLALTADKSARTMSVRGMQYAWAPRDKSISLFAGGPRNPTLLARITRTNGAIALDMTPDAIQLGLLDSVVAASLLLQCGRNID
ncbi:hypothetical protein JR316_0009071 [Psilocybe cubensis]|uniref:Uncharacterized protein n=2 Tax=Psilocybe cubensis TaxID=181762 RepID=A0ACB8GSQ7_PSICU|nr:hypothetical protein JR316_0009071 [Psilocybe cubensis]KAH9478614.1 hypothetical protein JR316_0009071 [Psilocybe cubensis]